MKPLSEKLKELERTRDAEEFSSSARAAYTVCIELLQAWIDGWHKEFEQAAANQRPDIMGPRYGAAIAETRKWIRECLLGTTRTEGKK